MKVDDGTRCNPRKQDICINGMCQVLKSFYHQNYLNLLLRVSYLESRL